MFGHAGWALHSPMGATVHSVVALVLRKGQHHLMAGMPVSQCKASQ